MVLCRGIRYFPSNSDNVSKVMHNSTISLLYLQQLFEAFEHAALDKQSNLLLEIPADEGRVNSNNESGTRRQMKRHEINLSVMRSCVGFTVERRPSSLSCGGTGVFVTSGTVPAGVITSLYPGKIFKFAPTAGIY